MATRTIALAGTLAGVYVALTLALAPLSYNVLQFRVAEAIKPLALFSPVFALSFGVGTFLANLASPFGPLDWGTMPFVDALAAWLCWRLRRWPVPALIVQAVVIAAGVAAFPLGLGARLPILPSFIAVLIPQLVILLGGYYLIWRRYGPYLLRWWQSPPGSNSD
jgi:uncharacterized membrane protein